MNDLVEFLLARIAEDEQKVTAMQVGWLTGMGIFVRPERWRAECAAKRQIIRWVTDETVICEVADPVLHALALPYADHEQFKEEWR